MPCNGRSPQCAASIPGGRLNPQALKRTLTLDPPVGNAVQRNATGKAQIFLTCFIRNCLRETQHDFLGHFLN